MNLRTVQAFYCGVATVLVFVAFGLWLTKPQNVHVDRVTTIYRTVPAEPKFVPNERVYVDTDGSGTLSSGTILGWRVNGNHDLVYAVAIDGWTEPQTAYPDHIVKVSR